MTDLEVVNDAKNKAILRAEKVEMQLSKAKEIIKKFLDADTDADLLKAQWYAGKFIKEVEDESINRNSKRV